MTFPTNPTAGQRHQEPSGIWYTWKACATGGAWEQDRAQLTYYDPIPLGAIQAFTIGTAPRGWLLCDGSTYDQTVYPELFAVFGSTTLPDLRGEFLRGRKAGQAIGSHVDWTTGRPKTALTGSTATDGNHTHVYQRAVTRIDAGVNSYAANNNDGGQTSTNTTGSGAHSHSLTVNGGGDAETAPDHTLVDFYIKASHAKINLPNAGFLTHATTLNDGDIWQFDAVSNTFKNKPVTAAPTGELWMVGSIQQTLLTEVQFGLQLGSSELGKWVLADGRSVAGTAYATATGNATVPDLRGAYLRMAGQNGNPAWNGGALNGYQEDTTRRPRNTGLTGTTSNPGGHTHSTPIQKTGSGSGNVASTNMTVGDGGNVAIGNWTNAAGAHTHTVTINGGGDAETRPKTFTVNYFIKVD